MNPHARDIFWSGKFCFPTRYREVHGEAHFSRLEEENVQSTEEFKGAQCVEKSENVVIKDDVGEVCWSENEESYRPGWGNRASKAQAAWEWHDHIYL